jgi:hypothetical protein
MLGVVAAIVAVPVVAFATLHTRRESRVNVITPGTQSVASLTDLQVRAHVGVGVPGTWMPVDYGEARIWVPSDWKVNAGDCPARGSGVVFVGVDPTGPCRNVGVTIGLSPIFVAPQGATPSRTVNGYGLYSVAPTSVIADAPQSFAVPELQVTITVPHSHTGDQILATLAPSARHVALNDTTPPPSGWQHRQLDGIELSVPTNWRVETVSDRGYHPCPFEPNPQDNALVRIRLVSGAIPAGYGCGIGRNPPTYPGPRAGSVDIESSPTGRRIPMSVDAPSGNPWDDRYLQVSGANGTHGFSITIGFGRDGRIAAAILKSIHLLNSIHLHGVTP